jgi:hypothetical protein
MYDPQPSPRHGHPDHALPFTYTYALSELFQEQAGRYLGKTHLFQTPAQPLQVRVDPKQPPPIGTQGLEDAHAQDETGIIRGHVHATRSTDLSIHQGEAVFWVLFLA